MLDRVRKLRLRGGNRNGRYAVLASVLLAVLVAPFAVAQSGSSGSRVTNNNDRYAFLARNTLAGDGGAAALACQSDVGSGKEPCLNMVNKGTGYAAAFRTRGLTGFRLQTSGNGEATPFVLDKNATKKVDYLNADKVDGLSSEEIGRERWARVNVAAGTGAPTLVRGNGTAAENPVTRASAGTYSVDFAADVNTCSFQATSADTGAARLIAADGDATNTKRVTVTVRDATGAGAGQPIDGAFSLAVNC
jgi:hypothetical protein